MNSKLLKIALEGMGCLLIALGLSFVPVDMQGFPLDLAIIPLTWFALRQGTIPGIVFSFLYGCIQGVLQFNGDITVLLVDNILAYTVIGLAGMFARNTVRTAFNHRLTSTVLNIVTATMLVHITTFALHGVATSMVPQTFYHNDNMGIMALAGNVWLNVFITIAIQLVLFIAGLYIRKQLFIPKNTHFISRKEQSHLLND